MVKTGNPATDKLFVQLSIAVRESFEIDNNLLPAKYTDKRRSKTSLAFAHRRAIKDQDVEISAHQLEKTEKAKRIEAYRLQMVSTPEGYQPPDGGIEYIVDEDKLYRAELEFCAAAVRSGMMEFGDDD